MMKWKMADKKTANKLKILLFVFLIAFSQILTAQIKPSREALPLINVREKNMPPGLVTDAFVTDGQRQAELAIRRKYPNLKLNWNPLSGTPRSLFTLSGFLTPASSLSADKIARDFLQTNRDLYNLSTADLETLALVRLSRSRGAEKIRNRNIQAVINIALDQRWQGRQVYPATLVGAVTGRGQLVSLSGEVVPNLAAAVNAVKPELAALQAVEKAAASIGANFDAATHILIKPPAGDEERQTFAGGKDFNSDVPVRLIYFMTARNAVRLVWEVTAGKVGDPYSYQVMVDALTGEILYRITITNSDTPRWLAYTEVLNIPTTHPKNDMRPRENPAPLSPGPAIPDGTQGAAVDPVLIQTNGDPAFSHDGWIADGTDTTTGNNVIAFADLNYNSNADAGEQPIAVMENVGGVNTRTFNFPADFTAAPETAANTNAAVTNIFFLTNWYHDRLYDLGFDEAAGNFQQTNFTADGLGGDPVKARIHVGHDNSYFSTPAADGTGYPTLLAYTFTGPDPDLDAVYDAQVMIHEFTHGLTNRIVGGPNVMGMTGLGPSEGYSDIYALLLLSNPGDNINGTYAMGGYITREWILNDPGWDDNYYFGIRHFPYSTDLCLNPLTLIDMQCATYDITPIPAAGCADTPPVNPWLKTSCGSIHDIGEIWASAIWEIRANLVTDLGWEVGNELVLQLLTDSLFLMPAGPTMIEARDAFLLADLARTGGANLCRIWEGFAKRGFGVGAATPVGGSVVEDFTPQTAESCRPLMDLALVLDFSDTMNSPEACDAPPEDIKIDVLKQAVPAFLNAWEPFAVSGDRIGIMYFDDDADPRSTPLLEDLLTNKAAILADVAARPTGIYTALGPGVLSAADSFDTRVRKRHMIVLSDGIQNVNPLVVSMGDTDGDGVDEHHVINSAGAWGGNSATVAEQPDKLLQDFNIPMHTLSIGSGPGTSYDELLAAIASETGGIHQHTCIPQIELENFLTTSLVEALQGDTVELAGYKTGTLDAAGVEGEQRFTLNGSVTRVVFMLSWSGGSGNPSDLNLRIFDPIGNEIPTKAYLTCGSTFQRVTLDFPLFIVPAGQKTATPVSFAGEWRLVVKRELSSTSSLIYRIYALVEDAALEYGFSIVKSVVATGESIPLQVKVTEGLKPLKPKVIKVNVLKPRSGVGNLIHAAQITDADRKRITAQLASRELVGSPLMQTYEVLFRNPANQGKLIPVLQNVELFDDGLAAHGDTQANDGIYSALFKDTALPGEYQFSFLVQGESRYHGAYTREKTASATVVIRKAEKTSCRLEIIEQAGKGGSFRLIIVPLDRYNNYLGPGYAPYIQLSLPGAEKQGALADRLDGSYMQEFRTTDFKALAGGKVMIFDTEIKFPGQEKATGFSLHGGMAVPLGQSSTLYEKGFPINLDYINFRKTALAWDLRLGYTRFSGKGTGTDSESLSLHANLRYNLIPNPPLRPFINAGVGIHLLNWDTFEGGYNTGIGVQYRLGENLTLEATANYHALFAPPPDLSYLLVQAGLVFLF